MSNVGNISYVEASNQAVVLMDKKDRDIQELLDMIDKSTVDLTNPSFHNSQKYDIIVSIEYILVRLRLLVETEHITVKRILQHSETPQSLRTIFMKRDQYLSQICLKLTSIRDDINALQKVVYTDSQFIRR